MTPPELLTQSLANRYAIERELGAGGMATVYLAEDLKHDRKVAIKVLKPELAAVLGAERFIVEIKTTAALQHPHILPLFDSGEAGGFLFYVMPYIRGETIRDRLNRETQLGVEEAVRIAREVADALDYAHRHGVIHRDIKPENILLHDGRAMVMDFGIALAVSAAAGGRMTETGLSLGTPHYMSPEQATAEKELTGRSDLYSLATVLYEMLAGDPPHTGASAQQIIMKIITEPAPPVTTRRKAVPPHVAAALATALEKLPADRFASAREFAQALGTTSYTGRATHTTVSGTAAQADWRARAAFPALVVAIGALTFIAWDAMRPGATQRVVRHEVVWPGDGLAVSPDGSRIVTSRLERGQTRLFTRSLDQIADVELPGTEDARNPSFSPDGHRIAFMSGTTIRVVDVVGGPTTVITDSLVGVPGLDWGADGFLYYDRTGPGPLLRVSEKGGVPEVVSTIDTAAKEVQHVWPHALPNGRGVLMVINRGGPGQGAYETDGIAILDLETKRHRELFRGIYARYSTSGHVLFVTREGTLMAVSFDQDRLEVTGAPVKIAEGIFVSSAGSGAVNLAISSDGTLWYASGRQTEGRHLIWATRDGTASPLDPPFTGNLERVALSPDGRQVAVITRMADGGHVWVSSVGSPNRRRITFERSFDDIAWHPDGRQILATLDSRMEILAVPTDGSAAPSPVLRVSQRVADARWSPDGAWLVYSARGDLYGLRPTVDKTPQSLFASAFGEQAPSVSPDGRWLLYQGANGSSTEVYVRPFPASTDGGLLQISSAGGRQPRWSPDGREIFYRTPTDSLVSVPVLPGPGFEVGTARGLFSMQGNRSWDISPDGKRFLLVRDIQVAAPTRLFVVENFFEELRTMVPR